jgi:hypothetical protein
MAVSETNQELRGEDLVVHPARHRQPACAKLGGAAVFHTHELLLGHLEDLQKTGLLGKTVFVRSGC